MFTLKGTSILAGIERIKSGASINSNSNAGIVIVNTKQNRYAQYLITKPKNVRLAKIAQIVNITLIEILEDSLHHTIIALKSENLN